MNKGIWVIIPLITVVALTPLTVNLYQAHAAAEITNVTIDKINSAKQGSKLVIHTNLEGVLEGDIEVKVCAKGANNAFDICDIGIIS